VAFEGAASPPPPSAVAAKMRSGASVMSGGSSQSRFSRLSAAEMVRRGVAFRASRMEPSLVSLRNSVLITFGIAASGTGNISQDGSGTTTLSATNTLSGSLNATAGTMIVTGTNLSVSAVNISSGATLQQGMPTR
jgi:autotransporter-associated beta strand protein